MIDAKVGTRGAKWALSETSSRALGLVTQMLAIGCGGSAILRVDSGLAVQGSAKCTADRDDCVRALFTFKLPAIYFSKRGYRIYLDG